MRKHSALFSALAFAAALGVDPFAERGWAEKKEEPPMKCRMDGCEKPRAKNRLYCSAECCKADRRER